MRAPLHARFKSTPTPCYEPTRGRDERAFPSSWRSARPGHFPIASKFECHARAFKSDRRSKRDGLSVLAATAGEAASDEILVKHIAASSKPAMQALFARHRTYVYRWLLRLVNNGSAPAEWSRGHVRRRGRELLPILGPACWAFSSRFRSGRAVCH